MQLLFILFGNQSKVEAWGGRCRVSMLPRPQLNVIAKLRDQEKKNKCMRTLSFVYFLQGCNICVDVHIYHTFCMRYDVAWLILLGRDQDMFCFLSGRSGLV